MKYYKDDLPREKNERIEKLPAEYFVCSPIIKEEIKIEKESNEKSESKTSKRKPKKNNPKIHKTTMA